MRLTEAAAMWCVWIEGRWGEETERVDGGAGGYDKCAMGRGC